MRRLRHPLLLISVLTCGFTMICLAAASRWTQRALVSRLREQIAAAQEEPAAELVPQLALLDSAGSEALVDLLDDGRSQVRAAARDALQAQLDRWSVESSEASERQVAELASRLARREPPRDLQSRFFVKLTALRLLRWPLRSKQVDRAELVDDCNQVLERTLAAQAPPLAPIVPRESPAEFAPRSVGAAADLRVNIADLPEPPIVREAEPALLPRGEEHLVPPERIEPDTPRRIRTSELDTQVNPIHAEALEALPTRSLIRHLHGLPVVAQSAEIELRRRGFSDSALKAARGLDDPDPQVRLRLVESLPHTEGIDPAAFMWELAEDTDDAVRWAARGVLSTSSNPITRKRLAQLQGATERK